MMRHMNKIVKASLVITIIIVVALLSAFWATFILWYPPSPWDFWNPWERRWPPPTGVPGDIELFYTAKTVVSSINVTLSVFLLATYLNVYRKTRSEFTIGLIIFSAVFLLNALVSNPFVIWVFGFQPFGLGPFALLPDLFTLVALGVLLYLSINY